MASGSQGGRLATVRESPSEYRRSASEALAMSMAAPAPGAAASGAFAMMTTASGDLRPADGIGSGSGTAANVLDPGEHAGLGSAGVLPTRRCDTCGSARLPAHRIYAGGAYRA